MGAKKVFFSKTILILFLCCLSLKGNTLQLKEIEAILSKNSDPGLIASNLRGQLGRDLITQAESKAIVRSFQEKGNWQTLLPTAAIEDPAPVKRIKPTIPPKPVPLATRQKPPVPPKPWIGAAPVIAPAKPTIAPKPLPLATRQKPPVPPKPWIGAAPVVAPRPLGLQAKFKAWKHRAHEEKEYKKLESRAPTIPNHSEPSYIGNLSNSDLVDGLKYWLSEQKLINKSLFQKINCLEVKENQALKGSSTESLFFVWYKPSCLHDGGSPHKKLLFIIKFLTPEGAKSELVNLNLVRNYPPLRHLGKINDQNLPRLTFGEKFYNFSIKPGHTGVIELLHAAKGNDFFSILFEDALEESEKATASRKLGETLANFQKRFMTGNNCQLTGGTDLHACKTIVHNDFHINNFFYDGKIIYWIDTEGMAKSIKERRSFFIDPIILISQVKLWGPAYWDKFKPYFDIFLESYLTTLTLDIPLRTKIKEEILKERTLEDLGRIREVAS